MSIHYEVINTNIMKRCKKTDKPRQREIKASRQFKENQPAIELFDSFDDVGCQNFGDFEYEVERNGLIYRMSYEKD